MNLSRIAPAIVIPAMLIAVSVHAQVMVCIDSQGRKEYSATCPPGTVSQKELSAKGASPQGQSAAPKPPSIQEQERAFQQRRLQRESAETDEAQKQKQQQMAERHCANARRKMEQLQSGRRLRWVDKATGERIVMTEAEHAAEMKIVAEDLRQCRS